MTVAEHQTAKAGMGSTILAAAEYKGKGSLEMYGLPSGGCYQNRQTASASKLLSVANHGGKIVFADGDGNLRWFERDGSTHIRTFNIQDSDVVARSGGSEKGNESQGIWERNEPGQGDIVQKILPLPLTSPTHSSSLDRPDSGRPDIKSETLLLWTGDGRLGILGFGEKNRLGEEGQEAEGEGKTTAEKAREDAERSYEGAMRRALERNADEVRFVRGLGMGY